MSDPRTDDADYRRRVRWGLATFVALVLFLVWREHGAHLLAALPWLVLLACTLTHTLVHRHREVPRDGGTGSARGPGRPREQREYGGGC
jgi:hypothetical protein